MADEYVRRTAITRLEVSEAQRELLEETVDEWRSGCQIAVNMAWDGRDSEMEVQPLAYDAVREQTDLGSQHAVLATHHAARAITSCIERLSDGREATKPTFTAPTVPYDNRTMTLFEDDTVSLTTIESRVRCKLALPDDEDGYQYRYLRSSAWEVTESTLTFDDDVYLHIGFRREKTTAERQTAENGTVLGVDLGVENVAVTSTARFFSGKELNHRLREFETVRAGLQRCGTRSARRTLVDASGRQLRRIRDEMHQVSNEIVAEAVRYDCDVIAVEDLTDVREETGGTWGYKWAFRTLSTQLEYKSEVAGIAVERVSAVDTSKQCSECGCVADANRTERHQFRCVECGSGANADYNAAKNIGLRYVRRDRQSSRRTGNCQLALKSGTVTADGNFSAYPSEFTPPFTDKARLRANPPG